MKKLVLLCLFFPSIIFAQNIIQYAENNDLSSLMQSVQNGANINQMDPGGFTALHISAWNGYIDILQFLLNEGADPNIRSLAGSTPIRFATPEAKAILLQNGAISEDSLTPQVPRLLYSPNIYIEQAPNQAPIKTIVSNIITNISNYIEQTVYVSNTYRIYDYPKKSYNLLTNLTPEQSIALHDWDVDGNNSIHQAARDGDLEKIQTLIKYGINPKAKNVNGDTALRFATENNHLDVVKYLVETVGLDVNNANRDGTTALIMATFNDNTNMIKYLAYMGANINQTASASVNRTVGEDGNAQNSSVTGWTALMAASQLGFTNSIKMLLDSGANLNATDSDNWNSLLFAVQNGYYDAAKLLIDRGINYNIESLDNNTALSLATLNGDESMIELLENIGAIESSVPLVSYEESYTEVPAEEGEYYDDYEGDYEGDYEDDYSEINEDESDYSEINEDEYTEEV